MLPKPLIVLLTLALALAMHPATARTVSYQDSHGNYRDGEDPRRDDRTSTDDHDRGREVDETDHRRDERRFDSFIGDAERHGNRSEDRSREWDERTGGGTGRSERPGRNRWDHDDFSYQRGSETRRGDLLQ